MRFYKIVSDQYLLSVGTGLAGEEITKDEYDNIMAIISDKPTSQEGFGYRLTTSLEWEMYEVSSVEPEEMSEIEQKAMAYDILMGVNE